MQLGTEWGTRRCDSRICPRREGRGGIWKVGVERVKNGMCMRWIQLAHIELTTCTKDVKED